MTINGRIRVLGIEECPRCLSNQTQIVDSRLIDGERIRKRKCIKCGEKYTTREIRI